MLPRHVGKVANTRADVTAVTKIPAATVAGRWRTPPAKLYRRNASKNWIIKKISQNPEIKVEFRTTKSCAPLEALVCCYFVLCLWQIVKYR